jgi:hypothetical protein
VAVFGTVLTRRTIYHTARYGEQINPYSDAFKQTVLRLQSHAMHATGGTAADALSKAKAQIGSFVANQAFIRAVADVFLIAGIVILIGVVPVLFLRTHKVPSARNRGGAKPVHAQTE